jgi:hypothetical protein
MKLDGGAKWEIEESFTANTVINRRMYEAGSFFNS